jgi:CRP/FNR family cyclic AMP-dependent transcriptional regulator
LELKDCQVFADISAEGLREVEKSLKKQVVSAGEAIFFEGEVGDRFYIVKSGKVSICTDIEGVGVEELASIGEGGFFGEMALIDENPRSASVVGREKTELWYLDKGKFNSLIEKNIVVANKFLHNLALEFCRRLRDSNQRICDYYRMNRTFHGG